MKRIKVLNIISGIITIGTILTILIWGIIVQFSSQHFEASCITLAVLAVVNVLIVFIKEATCKIYDSNKYDGVLFGGQTIFTIALHYGHYYIGHYDEFGWLYWLLLVIVNIFPIVLFVILTLKFKRDEKNNVGKPKFMVNNQK